MNCADARDIILSADPGALRDRTDPVLRQHLEGCGECAAAASHVVGDVARLRSALIARGSRAVVRPRRSSTKRVAMTLVPIALAAELAAFAFIGNQDSPNELLDRRPMIDDTVTSMLPVAHPRIDTVVATTPVAVTKAVARNEAKKDTATQKDSLLANFAPIDMPEQIQVMPRARQQYAVISTSNPKITVVWLTKGDTL